MRLLIRNCAGSASIWPWTVALPLGFMVEESAGYRKRGGRYRGEELFSNGGISFYVNKDKE